MSPLSRPERIAIALRAVPAAKRETVERVFAVEFRRHHRGGRAVVSTTEKASSQASLQSARLERIAEVMETTGLSAFDAALTLAIARLRRAGGEANRTAYAYAFPGLGVRSEGWDALFSDSLPVEWAKAADLLPPPRHRQTRPNGPDSAVGATWKPLKHERIALARFLARGGRPPYLGYTGLMAR